MEQVSSHEGAEVPEEVAGVSFSDPAFWRELSSALGVANAHSAGLEEASDASSDFSDPFDDRQDGSDSSNSDKDDADDSNDVNGVGWSLDVPPSSATISAEGQRRLRDSNEAPTSLQTGTTPSSALSSSQQANPTSGNRANTRSEPSAATPEAATATTSEPAATPEVATAASSEPAAASEAATATIGESGRSGGAAGHVPWNPDTLDNNVTTDTDSDDEEYSDPDSNSFRQAYDEVLSQQIAESRVGSLLQPGLAKAAAKQESSTRPVGTTASRATAVQEEEELQPVDLDTNMVQNLLQSYAAQEGLAGPAGNLAGLLGLRLPDNAE